MEVSACELATNACSVEYDTPFTTVVDTFIYGENEKERKKKQRKIQLR
jgi:hypothetical protein